MTTTNQTCEACGVEDETCEMRGISRGGIVVACDACCGLGGGAGRVTIEYAAVPNARGADHGWLPLIWIDGRQSGHTYAAHGYDRDVAAQLALADAREEAARYSGDYRVTITERASAERGNK